MPESHRESSPTLTNDGAVVSHETYSLAGQMPSTGAGGVSVPATVGRYRVVGVLGEGGMGVVYRAHDPELNRVVAIKMPFLGGHGAQMAVRRQRFLREARAAAAITHPNICPIHDVGEADGQPFVVMSFVEGESLADRMARAKEGLPAAEAVRLIRAVAEGLGVVHSVGIIHRDLKPGNILIDRAGNPILTDFGLARVLDDADPVTVEGAVMGTPAYMAPEQAAGRMADLGPRTDVYGLGAVLYHLLAGQPPFRGPTLSVLVKVQQEAPPSLRKLRGELDPRLVAVVERAMAREPDGRYPDVATLAAELGRVGVEEKGRGATGRRRWGWAVAVGVMVVVAGGWGLTWDWTARVVPPSPAPPTQRVVASEQPNQPGASVPAPSLPLEAEFSVLVWSARRDGPKRGMPIQNPAARPLLTDERVQFRVRFNRPAHAYLVWVSASGEVTLLHPWNRILQDRALPAPAVVGGLGDVVTYAALQSLPLPAPVGSPTSEVYSPAEEDSAWVLDDTAEIETVFLLARETPLPAGMEVRKLIGSLEVRPVAGSEEYYWLTLEPGKGAARYNLPGYGSKLRGVRLLPQSIDDPLLGAMKRLRTYFEQIEVVRFRHATNGR